MKLTIILLAFVGLVAAASINPTNKVTVADHAFLERQKFLVEIVYRVEDPLMFEEYIKLGQHLIYDQAQYTHFDEYMERFYMSYKKGALLPQGEYFSALVRTHNLQAYGLFNYFYYAKDWATFQQNVAWARMNVNEGMFVYALTLAVIHRDDFHGLMLPSIYEILPQYYNIDIEIDNEHSVLSYFTEDLGWNAYWYYLNLDYASFLDGKTYGLDKDRHGEWWIYNVDQLLARYYNELLSNGFGEIPEMSLYDAYEYGYDPELVSSNGVGYSYRKNYFEIKSYGNFELMNKFSNSLINGAIESGIYTTDEGHKIDLRKPESAEFIGSYLHGNVDIFDKYFLSCWSILSHMYFADVKYNDRETTTNVLLNFETMMRDPIFYSFYKKIASIYESFQQKLHPYNKEELVFPGVEIEDATVSELVTYFDKGSFVWDKSLYAHQMRLNHKPFNFELKVKSGKPQKVIVRTFYGPKFDEYGRLISINDNRKNFVELDEFVYELAAGENVIKRSSEDYIWTAKDRTTYTELYQNVMAAFDGKYELPLEISESHSNFPDRLLLPKGWESGLPMQFFFYIGSYEASVEQYSNYDPNYYSGDGSGTRYIDKKPFGYPLDRPIDVFDFFVPNMYFKNVSIYHNDTLKPYHEEYKNYGHFDHDFYDDYYTILSPM